MIIALALIGSAVAVSMVGQIPLIRLSRPPGDPRVAIVGWMVVLTSTVGSLALGLIVTVSGHVGVPRLLGLAGSCLTHLGHQEAPRADEVSAFVAVAALLVVGGRTATVAARDGRRRRRKRDHQRFLIRLAAGERGWAEPVVQLEHERPLAFTVPGRPGLVVMSSGTIEPIERLRPAAFTATREHELAHLRGRHHLALTIADTLATAFPLLPLMRQAPGQLRTLVEYAADAVAVERCGIPAVYDALNVFEGCRPTSTAWACPAARSKGAWPD